MKPIRPINTEKASIPILLARPVLVMEGLVIQAARINTCRTSSKLVKNTPTKEGHRQAQQPEHEDVEKLADRKALRCYRPKEWSYQAEEGVYLCLFLTLQSFNLSSHSIPTSANRLAGSQ